jgi:DNA-binding transcriptional regulator YhcF (GntR family)
MQRKLDSCVRKLKSKIVKLGPGAELPTITALCDQMNVSYPTVKKALKCLEIEGYVDNQESLGYSTAIRDMKSWISTQRRNLAKARTNLEIAKMLNKGGKLLGRFAISFDKGINAIDVISGEKLTTSEEEINRIISNPLALEIIESEKGTTQRIHMSQFIRQLELHDLAKVIHRHK